MRNLNNLKEVHCLNDKLATLSRFLPKLVEKAKPFFRLLKGSKKFEWDIKCEEMFQNIKKNISLLSKYL